MKNKPTRSSPKVYLHTSTQLPYFHVMLTVAREYTDLDGLVIRCQSDTEPTSETYAWDVGFLTEVADLDICKKGVRIIGAIDRKLTKWSEDFGNPKDFAEFAGRVLKALNVRTVECEVEEDSLHGCPVAVEDAKYVIKRSIDKFRKQYAAVGLAKAAAG